MAKRCFVDTETTGLSPWKHTIWQISGIIEVDGEVEEEFNFVCKPLETKEVDGKALAMNNLTIEDLLDNEASNIVKTRFTDVLCKYVDKYNSKDKFTMFGYNVKYDMDFIRQWFEDLGDKFMGSYFWFPPIDIMSVAMERLEDDRHKMKSFRLESVAKALGIHIDKQYLHNAMYDVRLTRAVYMACMGIPCNTDMLAGLKPVEFKR